MLKQLSLAIAFSLSLLASAHAAPLVPTLGNCPAKWNQSVIEGPALEVYRVHLEDVSPSKSFHVVNIVLDGPDGTPVYTHPLYLDTKPVLYRQLVTEKHLPGYNAWLVVEPNVTRKTMTVSVSPKIPGITFTPVGTANLFTTLPGTGPGNVICRQVGRQRPENPNHGRMILTSLPDNRYALNPANLNFNY